MSGRLRCWPEALAVIVHSVAGNEGKVVRCVRFVGDPWPRGADGEHIDCWEVDRDLPGVGGWIERDRFISDSRLRPITPPPGTDCTATDADKPQPVEAA